MSEEAVRALPQVAKAFADARQQVVRYGRALTRRHGTTLDLRSYVVVAVGLERILGEEVELAP